MAAITETTTTASVVGENSVSLASTGIATEYPPGCDFAVGMFGTGLQAIGTPEVEKTPISA